MPKESKRRAKPTRLRSVAGLASEAGLLLLFVAAPVTVFLGIPAGSSFAWAQSAPVIRSIKVEGNRRVESETVRSYLQFSPGSRYDPLKVDESLKSLFTTGLFSDVRIGRKGSTGFF